MKIVAFNGSPRKGGNTELLIKEVFKTDTGSRYRDRISTVGWETIARLCLMLYLFQDKGREMCD